MLTSNQLRPFVVLHFSRRTAVLALAAVLAIGVGSFGCMGLDGGSRNGTQLSESNVTIPANTTIEVVYPYPFATPPTLQIYAWHGDWKIVEQDEKSFKIMNKNPNKPRTVEWQARGTRVMQQPRRPENRVINTPLTTPTMPPSNGPAMLGGTPVIENGPQPTTPTAPATIGPPR